MIRLSFFLVGLFVLKFIMAEAHAQTKHERARNIRQRERIEQGVESGELTKKEARMLKKEEKEIRKAELAASSDGKITADEKKQIEQMQNKTSRDIRRMKHNKRTR